MKCENCGANIWLYDKVYQIFTCDKCSYEQRLLMEKIEEDECDISFYDGGEFYKD